MNKIVIAPQKIESDESIKLFLAGGITNCPDWQSEMIRKILDLEITIINPRRNFFPIDEPESAEEQITWEFEQLKNADIITFWFSDGSINPIVLYELGMWGNSREIPIFIGVSPSYKRAQDVVIQTKLAKPELEIAYSIDELCSQINAYIKTMKQIKK